MRKFRFALAVAAAILGVNGIAIAGEAPTSVAAAPAGTTPVQVAQADTAAPADSGLEEIIVTARKREERVQDVPLAITALSPETLERQSVAKVTDLSGKVPSLLIIPGPGDSRSLPSFTIRGQRQQLNTVAADNSVGVYFGDIAVARPAGVNASMFDLQSVEVLKGPQGTLFGRNTTGGAIVIKPHRPTDKFEGSIKLNGGNYNAHGGEFMLNMPLSEWASLRIAGAAQQKHGFADDVINGNDYGGQDYKAFRGSLLLTPTDSLESLFVFNRFIEDSEGTPYKLKSLDPAFFTALAPTLGYVGEYSPQNINARAQAQDYDDVASGTVPGATHDRGDSYDIANTTTYALTDKLSVKNILGYREMFNDAEADPDGSPLPINHINKVFDADQFSEEFQLSGHIGRLKWVTGAYYFHEDASGDGYSYNLKALAGAPGAASPNFGPGLTVGSMPRVLDYASWQDTAGDAENESKSLFAQGTYDLSSVLEGLSTTLGVRYTWDERSVTARSNRLVNGVPQCRLLTADTGGVPLPIDQCAATNDYSNSEPSWTASLEYKASPNSLVYIATRRGYRSGGLNLAATQPSFLETPFKAETVDDIEVGAKKDWFFGDMSLRTNVALYHSDYQNIQRNVSVFLNGTIASTVVNAASAKINGGELEVTFLPFDGLELTGSYAVTLAKYDKFEAFLPNGTTQDFSNNSFAGTPPHTYFLSGRYRLPFDAKMGEVWMQASYNWIEGYYTDDTNPVGGRNDSYGLLNLRADWSNVAGGPVDLGLFVNNATDKEYATSVYALSQLGFASYNPGEPRTVGAEIRYRFGG